MNRSRRWWLGLSMLVFSAVLVAILPAVAGERARGQVLPGEYLLARSGVKQAAPAVGNPGPAAVGGRTPAASADKGGWGEAPALRLEEVVVTATRDWEEVRKVPAAVSVITEEDIKKSGATSLVEVLEKLEGVQIRSYSGQSPESVVDLRGFGGDNPFGKTLVLIDGRRQNRPDMSPNNWFQIPLGNIERVEVVRGANTVLYGDNAIGGVINIITKKGKGKPAVMATATAGGYGLNNERISITGRQDKLSYSVNGENYFSWGYRERSRLASQSVGFDLGYDLGENFQLSLGMAGNHSDYHLPGALTKQQMDQDRRQYQPATPANWTNAAPDDDGRDRTGRINLGATAVHESLGQLDLLFGYGKNAYEFNMPSWFFNSYVNTDMDSLSFTPKYTLEKDIFGLGNKLTAGLDYYDEPYRKTSWDSRERQVKTGWAELRRKTLEYYVRDELSLWKRLLLAAGYRAGDTTLGGDHTDATAPANSFSNQEKRHPAEAWEGSATVLLGKKSNLYGKYARIYRIPFLDEQASFNGWGGGFYTSLEKEQGQSMEVGTLLYPLEALKVSLSLFRIDMEDEITWNNATKRNENLDRTRHQGLEGSFSWNIKGIVTLSGQYTYHMATFEDGQFNKRELPMVPNRIMGASADIKLPFSFTLRPEVRYVSDCYLSGDYDNNTEKLPSFIVYNLFLFFERRQPLGKHFLNIRAFAAVENINDEKYAGFGTDNASWGGLNTYYPMPERTFKGGLSLEF
ncbi:MAG: TonB-dependent receptor [Pseudomonadota bacterium]|nr:TonB-dependent receptor [Pseudomonadota bacterium]